MTDQPGYLSDRVLRGLSLRRRVGYVVAGLSGAAAAALVSLLWATEPQPLPARTQVAFAATIAVGVAWTGIAAWALARRPLFALDRMIAASLAIAFTALTATGAALLALTRHSMPTFIATSALGLMLIAVFTAVLVRARRYRAAVLARKRTLEAQFPDNPAGRGDEDSPFRQPGMTGARRLLPIGPLALSLRHVRSGSSGRRVMALALILAVAIVAGLVLLLG